MKTNIDILEQMLGELITACQDDHIELYAVTRDAERLLEGNLKRSSVVGVDFAVFADYYETLCDKLSENGERKVETMRINPHMDGIGIRYVNTQTSYFDPMKSGTFLYNGLFLNIWPLIRRPRKTIHDKRLNLGERLWEEKEVVKISGKEISFGFRCKRLLNRFFWLIHDEKRFGQILLDKQLSRSKKHKGDYTLHFPNEPICRFSKEETSIIYYGENAGFPVYVFQENSQIGRKYYKTRRSARAYSLMSANIPWNEYARYTKNEYLNQRSRIIDLVNRRERDYFSAVREARQYWNLIQLSYDRIQFYYKYAELKGRHQEFYQQKKFDALAKELFDYTEALKYYTKRKLSLCFDLDYLEIAMVTLMENGNRKVPRRAIRHLKPEHTESVEEYLKREAQGGVCSKEALVDRHQEFVTRMKKTIDKYKAMADQEELSEDAADNVDENGNDENVLEETQGLKIHPFRVEWCENSINIYIEARNTSCDNLYKEIYGQQEIFISNLSMPVLDEEVEYNSIHIKLDRFLEETDIWKHTLNYYIKYFSNNEKIRYVSYYDTRYLLEKVALCYLTESVFQQEQQEEQK